VHEWAAEIAVDEALVRRLLADQFGLEPSALRLLAAGWDNSVWLADEHWAFRFPRRRIAVPGIERELAVLPRLEPLLPVPIPVPALVGVPGEAFPWPFFGSALLPGREPTVASPPEGDRDGLASSLGAFLRALHDPGVVDAVDADGALPVDVNRRADMAARAPRARKSLAVVEALGLWRVPPLVDELLAEAERLPPVGPGAVVHGDLHFRHVLVDGGALSGVIDWGDVCRADPAVDLQLVWSFLPPAGRAAFLDAYGPVSDEQLLRARVLALSLCAALAAYGHHESLLEVKREALAGLGRTVLPG
jgi:aminoglycoside phosphotransferase (APT) family kinase protein